jgi:dTDP-4-amino-4,6-dideoxygalactose transaminase
VAQIPLVDLAFQHRELADEIEAGFRRVIRGTSFVLGPDVAAFETRFAEFIGARHCIGAANGTDALELALRAVGVGPGDEVILPTNSFVATAFAVTRIGATPALVDCDPVHQLLDVDQVEAAIGDRTRAIVPVHLFGQMADMERLEEISNRTGIPLVEDAAQAHGAKRHGRRAGSIGVAAGFSFYPGKNLGAYGDAGAVTTDDETVARTVRAMGDSGRNVSGDHQSAGDSLQAVVLLVKLASLPAWNDLRQQAAARYDEMLANCDRVRRPSTDPGNEHAWHLYVVRVPDRDTALKRLNEAGIGASVHYPTPIHLSGAYRSLGFGRGSFPVAEQAADEILSLPLFPGIREEQQARVVEKLVEG